MSHLVLLSAALDETDRVVTPAVLELLRGRGRRVSYLPASPGVKRLWFREHAVSFGKLGLALEYCDLQHELSAAELEALFSSDAIHLSGGNTFRFLLSLHGRRLIEPLRRYAAGGGVLIGVSAGAILMTPDIGTAALCGDKRSAELESDAGLSLVDFGFLPHFSENDSARKAALDAAARYPGGLFAAGDGAAVIVSGGEPRRLGEVHWFR